MDPLDVDCGHVDAVVEHVPLIVEHEFVWQTLVEQLLPFDGQELVGQLLLEQVLDALVLVASVLVGQLAVEFVPVVLVPVRQLPVALLFFVTAVVPFVLLQVDEDPVLPYQITDSPLVDVGHEADWVGSHMLVAGVRLPVEGHWAVKERCASQEIIGAVMVADLPGSICGGVPLQAAFPALAKRTIHSKMRDAMLVRHDFLIIGFTS